MRNHTTNYLTLQSTDCRAALQARSSAAGPRCLCTFTLGTHPSGSCLPVSWLLHASLLFCACNILKYMLSRCHLERCTDEIVIDTFSFLLCMFDFMLFFYYFNLSKEFEILRHKIFVCVVKVDKMDICWALKRKRRVTLPEEMQLLLQICTQYWVEWSYTECCCNGHDVTGTAAVKELRLKTARKPGGKLCRADIYTRSKSLNCISADRY